MVNVLINDKDVLWLKAGISINSSGLSGVLTYIALFPEGAYKLLSVGPNNPKVGIPVAAARCIKPESFPINILDNVVIGSGSVVTKNCKKNKVYVGNPAKILKW